MNEIRRLRQKKGISIQMLAEMSGVCRPIVAALDTREDLRSCTRQISSLCSIAEALECSTDRLVYSSPVPQTTVILRDGNFIKISLAEEKVEVASAVDSLGVDEEQVVIEDFTSEKLRWSERECLSEDFPTYWENHKESLKHSKWAVLDDNGEIVEIHDYDKDTKNAQGVRSASWKSKGQELPRTPLEKAESDIRDWEFQISAAEAVLEYYEGLREQGQIPAWYHIETRQWRSAFMQCRCSLKQAQGRYNSIAATLPKRDEKSGE